MAPKPGPSTYQAPGGNKPKTKLIPRTIELLKRNESAGKQGKEKVRDVLGNLRGLMDRESGEECTRCGWC
jgi:hypothetical protein